MRNVSPVLQQQVRAPAHLQDAARQPKDDTILHSVVLDEKVHVVASIKILECPVDVAIQSLGHVGIKVL